MITSFELYWLISLDAIVNFLKALTVISALTAIVTFMIVGNDDCDCKEALLSASKIVIISLVIMVLSCLGVVFVPTTSQAMMIKTIPAIVNGEDFKNVTGDAREIYRKGIIIIKNELDKKIGESVK
jgi:hypothetical protein